MNDKEGHKLLITADTTAGYKIKRKLVFNILQTTSSSREIVRKIPYGVGAAE